MLPHIISTLLLLLVIHSATAQGVGGIDSHCDNVSSSDPQIIAALYCQSTLFTTKRFTTFQEAIDFIQITGVNNSLPNIAVVCLPPGYHELKKQVEFGEVGLVLVGSVKTTVECSYGIPKEFDYTWHFNQSNIFHLQQTRFVNCPRPFRVIAVQDVSIQNCTFE